MTAHTSTGPAAADWAGADWAGPEVPAGPAALPAAEFAVPPPAHPARDAVARLMARTTAGTYRRIVPAPVYMAGDFLTLGEPHDEGIGEYPRSGPVSVAGVPRSERSGARWT